MNLKITTLLSAFIMLMTFQVFSQGLPCDNSIPGSSVVESEICGGTDNDDCNNSQAISCGNIVTGFSYNEGLFGSFDTDWYTFTVSENSQVSITLNASRSYVFTIIDNCVDQNVLAVGINDACIEASAFATLEPGTYYINIFPLFSFSDTWTCDDHLSYSFKLNCNTDPVGCTLEAIASGTDPSCGGSGDDGSIFLAIINGQPFYSVEWDNGSIDQDLFGLTAGTYCYTVTDGLGCTVSDCVTLSAATCSTPDFVTASNVTNSKATISWIGNACATKYRIQVRKQGTSTWTTYFVNGFSSSKQLTGLEPGTTYQFRVRSVCSLNGSVMSPFSPTQTFTTTGCAAPGAPSVNVLSANEVEVLWNTVPGVTKYRIRYRPLGTSTWSLKIVPHPQNSAVINNLAAATTYQYQLLSVCTDGTNLSDPTAISTFTTNAFRLDADVYAPQVQLFPNPTTGTVTLQIHNNATETATLEVYDVLGKQLQTEQLILNNGITALTRNYASLSKGVYFIRINSNGNISNLKFVKE